MKRIIYLSLSLVFATLFFSSCTQTYTDLMTADAKAGGILEPTGSFPYKLGGTKTFSLSVGVPQGPGITSIEVYKSYTGKAEVLDQTIPVSSANATAPKTISLSYTYAKLITGLNMPTDEGQLKIGDAWTLRYVSVMEDGRKVEVGTKTLISVANFFAGSYDLLLKYFHPTAGGTYPTSAYGGDRKSTVSLLAVAAYDCTDFFGVWVDNIITIHIAPDYKVTLTFNRTDAIMGDPLDAKNICSYDPATGIIKLYYYYPGAGGPRVFWAVYTPKK
jgi:hypothetical protein